MLIIMTILAGALAFSRGFGLSTLGLGWPRLSTLATWSLIPSALLLGGMFAVELPHRYAALERLPFYLFFVFVSAPAQEFVYRSVLFAELRAAHFPPLLILLVSSLLYAFLHVIYRDAMIVALTFVVGLIWGLIFLQTHSFYAVALSHAIVGAAAILLGTILIAAGRRRNFRRQTDESALNTCPDRKIPRPAGCYLGASTLFKKKRISNRPSGRDNC